MKRENLLPLVCAMTAICSALNLFVLQGISMRVERLEGFFMQGAGVHRTYER